MPVVIRLEGIDGMTTPHDGQYVRVYDPSTGDAPDECVLETTPDIAQARRYASIVEAADEWARVDQRTPIRRDGKPNRPLTVFAWTPVSVPA